MNGQAEYRAKDGIADVSGDVTEYLERAYAIGDWDLIDELEAIRDIDCLDVVELGNGEIEIVDIYTLV